MQQLTPQEARKWLQDHNFVELPQGSYFRWLEEEWFDRYKTVLTFKNNAWIPASNKLVELNALDQAYKDYQFRSYRDMQPQEEALEIPKTVEPKQETIVNANGEVLPF